MLAGKRTAVVAPWRAGKAMQLHTSATTDSVIVAALSSGVLGDVTSCTGDWCQISAGGFTGWIDQSMLWGVYPGETVN
jgi:SH3-like domain-containing protein